MATKNNPGKFDYYTNAEPDEPMFVLLARDPHAPMVIRQWIEIRRVCGESEEKLLEAMECVWAMESWWFEHRKA